MSNYPQKGTPMNEHEKFLFSRRAFLNITMAAAGTLATRHILTSTAHSQSAKELVWAKPLETTQLDPHTAILGSSWQVLHLIYSSLVDVDGDLRPVPALAESWKEENPTSYLFNLRDGVKFSDGSDLTVDDVIGSLMRVRNPATGSFWRQPIGPISKCEAVGERGMRITLEHPHAPLLPALAATMASILPMSKMKDGSFDPTKMMLGTGPFMVAEHVQDDHWILERNPYYWEKGLPHIDRISVRIVPNDNARIAMLTDGSADIASFEASPDAPMLLQNVPGIDVTVETSTNYYFMALNAVSESSPFTSAPLRKAVALSLDRQQIKDIALGGVGDPTAVMAPAFKACNTADLPNFARNIERAKSLVAEAGAKGKSFELLVRNIPADVQMAQVIKQGVSEIGLDATISVVDEGIWVKRAWVDNPSQFEAMISWYAGYADPAISTLWWNPALAGFTAGHVKADPEIDRLIDAAYQTTGEARAPILQELCAAIDESANVIPLVTRQDTIAVRTGRVTGMEKQTEGYVHTLRGIEKAELN